jgi:hypothetical protein
MSAAKRLLVGAVMCKLNKTSSLGNWEIDLNDGEVRSECLGVFSNASWLLQLRYKAFAMFHKAVSMDFVTGYISHVATSFILGYAVLSSIAE